MRALLALPRTSREGCSGDQETRNTPLALIRRPPRGRGWQRSLSVSHMDSEMERWNRLRTLVHGRLKGPARPALTRAHHATSECPRRSVRGCCPPYTSRATRCPVFQCCAVSGARPTRARRGRCIRPWLLGYHPPLASLKPRAEDTGRV